MTQEELDALMNGDVDLESMDEVEESKEESKDVVEDMEYGRVEPTKAWPPPPPNDDNKVVHQLDDVTKESEEKANEILEEVALEVAGLAVEIAHHSGRKGVQAEDVKLAAKQLLG